MIKFLQRPGVLLDHVQATPGSFMVKCGEKRMKLTVDLIYDRESALVVEQLVRTFKDLFNHEPLAPDGTIMRLGEMMVDSQSIPRETPKVVDAEVVDVSWCTKHVYCRGFKKCQPLWSRLWHWFKETIESRQIRPLPWE